MSDVRDVTVLVNHIEESLKLQTDKFMNIIHFDNSTMKNRMHIKVEQKLRYNMKVWYKNDAFDMLKNISEYVTFVQLMDSLVNVNHAIIILGYCIFDSNYEKSLFLTQ